MHTFESMIEAKNAAFIVACAIQPPTSQLDLLRLATLKARARGHKTVGSSVAKGMIQINTVEYVGRKTVVTKLGAPQQIAAAINFLNGLK